MGREAAMNATASWGARVDAYLAYRRSLGFSLLPESLYLPQFARFAEQQRAPRLTAQLAMDWACTSTRQTPITRANRIMRLRGFAKYCQRFDPTAEIPPPGLFGRTRRRLVPHIYTEQELTELLDATSKLRPHAGLRPLTYQTVFALLASCGLRIGEVTRLTRADVDLECGVLSIRGAKRHKSRFVPRHSSTVGALATYAQERDRKVLSPQSDHFFLLDKGKPPSRPRICLHLARLGQRPRLEATRRLRSASSPGLSTHLYRQEHSACLPVRPGYRSSSFSAVDLRRSQSCRRYLLVCHRHSRIDGNRGPAL